MVADDSLISVALSLVVPAVVAELQERLHPVLLALVLPPGGREGEGRRQGEAGGGTGPGGAQGGHAAGGGGHAPTGDIWGNKDHDNDILRNNDNDT